MKLKGIPVSAEKMCQGITIDSPLSNCSLLGIDTMQDDIEGASNICVLKTMTD